MEAVKKALMYFGGAMMIVFVLALLIEIVDDDKVVLAQPDYGYYQAGNQTAPPPASSGSKSQNTQLSEALGAWDSLQKAKGNVAAAQSEVDSCRQQYAGGNTEFMCGIQLDQLSKQLKNRSAAAYYYNAEAHEVDRQLLIDKKLPGMVGEDGEPVA